jgi:glycosyltransferase involved in cell wall biosynthesis
MVGCFIKIIYKLSNMYKILNNSKQYSGNNTTLNRLSRLLNLELVNNISKKMIGIHAYKFGKLVVNNDIEFILIIGGTDINIDINNINKNKIIVETCKQAKYIVAFNNIIKQKLLNHEIVNKKIKIIPQSIEYIKSIFFDIKNLLKNKFKIKKINKFFICLGNIRPVKDPMYLKQIFDILYKKSIYLIFIGNILSGDYSFTKGIIHIGPLEHKYILSCLEQSNGLINTSISEGMSISILESMIHKCPVYCRNNESNSDIIKNNFNGFLFNSPNEFLDLIELDTSNIIENAYKYVIKYHNSLDEKKRYSSLL